MACVCVWGGGGGGSRKISLCVSHSARAIAGHSPSPVLGHSLS